MAQDRETSLGLGLGAKEKAGSRAAGHGRIGQRLTISAPILG